MWWENTELKVTGWAGGPRADRVYHLLSVGLWTSHVTLISLSIQQACCANRDITHKSINHWLLVPSKASSVSIHWSASDEGRAKKTMNQKATALSGSLLVGAGLKGLPGIMRNESGEAGKEERGHDRVRSLGSREAFMATNDFRAKKWYMNCPLWLRSMETYRMLGFSAPGTEVNWKEWTVCDRRSKLS